jgi:SAM-dependent methyltransferase
MSKKKPVDNPALPAWDKYFYYESSVQNPSNEVEFLSEKYNELRKKKAHLLREDFCGTAAISCKWVEQSPEHYAWGVDLDPEPIEYGKNNHLASIAEDAQGRMKYLLENVLEASTPKTDIIFAFNFSYFIFKEREVLLNYFKSVYRDLKDDGVFFIDIFGGPDSQTVMTDVIEHDHWKYYWDCMEFNPLNNHCKFGIHIKRKGEQKRKEVFAYDWRMYSMAELKDLLKEAGFSQTISYWEEDDEDDDGGNGVFYPSEVEENCDAWVTYIAALK